MVRFWQLFVEPFVRTLKPRRIMEIGADSGSNTRRVLKYCLENDCRLDVVDPAPQPRLFRVMRDYEAISTYHPLPGLEGMPIVEHPDLVLLDGDHNWQTVHAELTLMRTLSEQRNEAFPCVLAHDVAWPYARRDMYYAPEKLRWTHPYAYKGIIPGRPELVEDGMNQVLANALVEGGPRNGVLTAIEDFIEAAPFEIEFRKLPFFNGLGILVPRARMTPELQTQIDSFFSGETLLRACEALENDGMTIRAKLAETQIRMGRRTESLKRAREQLKMHEGTIAKLRRKLGARLDPSDDADL